VAGDVVDESQLLGFFLLRGEEAGVFDGDGGFAGEDTQQLDVAFIERAFLQAMHGHHTDGLIIQDERNGADRTGLFLRFKTEARGFFSELLADQERLNGANYMFREVIAGGACAFGLAHAFDDFDFEANLFRFAVVVGDEEAVDVEQALHFGINAFEECVGLEGGAQGTANFVQDVKLFAAARGLLDQIAILDGHADLVAEGEEQAQFRGREISIVRRAEEQHSEDAVFGLKADADDGSQALSEQHLANVAERLFFFEGEPVAVAREVAQDDESTEAGDEADDVIVEIIFLHGGAEGIVEAGDDDGCWAIFIAIVQDEGAGGDAHDVEDAIQSLRQHFLDFTAGKAGSGQIQIGESQHVAFDAAALFVVDGHQHEDATDNFGEQGEGQKTSVGQGAEARLVVEEQEQSAGYDEGAGQQLIGA
jgi:hypothetical protein